MVLKRMHVHSKLVRVLYAVNSEMLLHYSCSRIFTCVLFANGSFKYTQGSSV
jgi:hypothetical protein